MLERFRCKTAFQDVFLRSIAGFSMRLFPSTFFPSSRLHDAFLCCSAGHSFRSRKDFPHTCFVQQKLTPSTFFSAHVRGSLTFFVNKKQESSRSNLTHQGSGMLSRSLAFRNASKTRRKEEHVNRLSSASFLFVFLVQQPNCEPNLQNLVRPSNGNLTESTSRETLPKMHKFALAVPDPGVLSVESLKIG